MSDHNQTFVASEQSVTKPLRVVYLHQYFTTPCMQGGTRSYEMARRLVEAGHQVHMITSDRSRTGAPYETCEAGIRVTWIPVPYSNSMGNVARICAFLQFALVSARFAARTEADVIFATSTPLTIAIPAIYAKLRRRIPMVFEVRDLWPEMPIAVGALRNPISKWAARLLERFTYRNAEQIVALSPGIKDGIIAQGFPAERVTVIPNACDFELFRNSQGKGKAFRSAHAWLQHRPLVVYTGTIGKLNGLSYMVRLAHAALAIDPEVRFLLVGNGKEEENVRRLARDLGVLDRNFFMTGGLEKSQVPQILGAADIALSLFLDIKQMWANSANKFFDALAAGKPVAINYGGWQAELLQQHQAGLVLDPTDPSHSAQVLLKALGTPGWVTEAGRNAATLGKTCFDRDKLARDLEGVLVAAAGMRPQQGIGQEHRGSARGTTE